MIWRLEVILLTNDSVTVHKFGGSCLRDYSDLDQIASIIQTFPGRPVIVVSALWGTTDRLMRAANEPKYATRLVDDLRRQHIRFAPNIENSEFGKMFASVLSGIETSLSEISKKTEDINHVNTLLAAGERLSRGWTRAADKCLRAFLLADFGSARTIGFLASLSV